MILNNNQMEDGESLLSSPPPHTPQQHLQSLCLAGLVGKKKLLGAICKSGSPEPHGRMATGMGTPRGPAVCTAPWPVSELGSQFSLGPAPSQSGAAGHSGEFGVGAGHPVSETTGYHQANHVKAGHYRAKPGAVSGGMNGSQPRDTQGHKGDTEAVGPKELPCVLGGTAK